MPYIHAGIINIVIIIISTIKSASHAFLKVMELVWVEMYIREDKKQQPPQQEYFTKATNLVPLCPQCCLVGKPELGTTFSLGMYSESYNMNQSKSVKGKTQKLESEKRNNE